MNGKNHFVCRCRRCRHKWDELHGDQHTEGIGQLRMCPRCYCEKIERVSGEDNFNNRLASARGNTLGSRT